MTAKSYSLGHPIIFKDGGWVYEDTGWLVDHERACKKCGREPGAGGLDPCLVPLISALNGAGLKTVASCCGHGYMPANIILDDGREVIIARSWKEARKMYSVIEYNICGEKIDKKNISEESPYEHYCECGADLGAYDYSDSWEYCPYCGRRR